MATSEQFLKELEISLRAIHDKLREELRAIRGNRPSVEMIQDIRVNLYDQELTIRQLGSLSIMPPKSIQIGVWDKNAVGAVIKAVENAKTGLSLTNDGNNVIATLSPLGNERREELMKLVKKISEAARIQVRAKRDDVIKKLRDGESKKEISEDSAFRTKEKIQKSVDDTNGKIESMVSEKIKELGSD